MSNIDNLTYAELKQIASLMSGGAQTTVSHPFKIGANYLIRTVTMTLTGKLVAVHATELVLVDAAWIADTGRYAQAVEKAAFNEVEPYPDGCEVIVGRGAIVDAAEIPSLPRKQK